jgi:Xaa-Pro aminopeptidase
MGWHEKLNNLLGGKSVIGIEPSTKVEVAEKIANRQLRALPLVEELRMLKSKEETEIIRAAAGYADYGMGLMCAGLYRGATPLELFSLSRKIQTKIILRGQYDPLASEFLTACWPAPYSAAPHSIPALNAAVGDGPIVLMSFLRVNGYAAECERTVFIKRPDSDARDVLNNMTQARNLAFNMLKPGAGCSDIDQAVTEYLSGKGLGKYLLHRVGHGIGLGNHEQPWISTGSEDSLKEGMVISIEPGIYIPGVGGFRHSDTVLITNTGYECLTKFPVELDKLIFNRPNVLKIAKGALIRKALHQ